MSKILGKEIYIFLEAQNIGIVDLRSAGYYYITRDGIQRCLHERFILFPRLSLTNSYN